MRTIGRCLAAGLLATLAGGLPSSFAQQQLSKQLSQAKTPARDYPVKPVPFTSVHFNDVFWTPRIEVNRTVSIPFAFQKSEETGRVTNFELAAAVLHGTPPAERKIPPYPFDDTDLYKVIEGASYALTVKPDPKLEAYVDSLIEKIAAAQATNHIQDRHGERKHPEKPAHWGLL